MSVPSKRALPTPRAEGMENIVAATLRLLQTKSPQDVTLRDVAEESGHGHRLIVEWFGGKGGLYAAVVNQIFLNLRESGDLFYASVPTRPEVISAFQIFNYMHMHHREFVNDVRDMIVLNVVKDRLTSGLGIPQDRASLGARRLAVLTLGLSLFGEFFEMSEDETVRLMQVVFLDSTGFELPAHPAPE